jgi:hypothetical protein
MLLLNDTAHVFFSLLCFLSITFITFNNTNLPFVIKGEKEMVTYEEIAQYAFI